MIWNNAMIRFRISLAVIAITIAGALAPTKAQAEAIIVESRNSRTVACLKAIDNSSDSVGNLGVWLASVFPAMKALFYTRDNVNRQLMESVLAPLNGGSLNIPPGEVTAKAAKYLAAGGGVLTKNFNETRAPVIECFTPEELVEPGSPRARPTS